MDLTNMVKDGWEAYQSFQQTYPLLNSMITGSVIYTSADAASQLMTEKKIDKRKIKYTAGISPVYGLLTHWVVEGGEFIGKGVQNNPLVKSLSAIALGNVLNGIFFSNNQIGEKNNYNLKDLVKNYSKILHDKTDTKKIKNTYKRFQEKFVENVPTKEFRECVAISFPYWLTINMINFSYTPEPMRTPVVMAAAFGWTCLLSLWSLKGRKKIKK
jgi:hypothetical protein